MSTLATKGTSWLLVLLMTILSWFGLDIDKSYEAYIVPANSTLTVISEDGGETVYTAGQRFSKSKDIAVGSTFTDGEYKYILSSVVTTNYTTKRWGATVIDKTKTSYASPKTSTQAIRYHKYSDEEELLYYQGLFGYYVTSVNFDNCVNMTELPKGLLNYNCYLTILTCANCKSLKSVPAIPKSIEVLSGAFVGCESLTAPPQINAARDSYPLMDNAFENCPNIVFPNGYRVNCGTYYIEYSEKNNEWYFPNRSVDSNLVQGVLNQLKLRDYKYAGIAVSLDGLSTSFAALTSKRTTMKLSFNASNPDDSYWLVDINGYSANEIEAIKSYWTAEDNVFCGYKVAIRYNGTAIVQLSDTLSICYNSDRNVYTVSRYEDLSDLETLNDLGFKYGDCLIDASDMKASYEYCTCVFRQNLNDISKSYIEVSVASEYNGKKLDLTAANEILQMFAEDEFKAFGYDLKLNNLNFYMGEDGSRDYVLHWTFVQDTSDWQKSYWSVTAMSKHEYYNSLSGQDDDYDELCDGLDLDDAREITELFAKSEFKFGYDEYAFDVRLKDLSVKQMDGGDSLYDYLLTWTFVQNTSDWQKSYWSVTAMSEREYYNSLSGQDDDYDELRDGLDLDDAREIVEDFARMGFKYESGSKYAFDVRLKDLTVTRLQDSLIVKYTFVQDTSDYHNSYWKVKFSGQYVNNDDIEEYIALLDNEDYTLGDFDIELNDFMVYTESGDAMFFHLNYWGIETPDQELFDSIKDQKVTKIAGYDIKYCVLRGKDGDIVDSYSKSISYKPCELEVKICTNSRGDSSLGVQFDSVKISCPSGQKLTKDDIKQIVEKRGYSADGVTFAATALSLNFRFSDECTVSALGSYNSTSNVVYVNLSNEMAAVQIQVLESDEFIEYIGLSVPEGTLTWNQIKSVIAAAGYDVSNATHTWGQDSITVHAGRRYGIAVDVARGKATVNIRVTELGDYRETISMTISDGETLTWDAARNAVSKAGYDTTYAVYEEMNLPIIVKGGQTYNLTVDVDEQDTSTDSEATVNIAITQSGTPVGSTVLTLSDGETLTWDAARSAVRDAGYDTTYAVYSGQNLPLVVEGGQIYSLTVDVE